MQGGDALVDQGELVEDEGLDLFDGEGAAGQHRGDAADFGEGETQCLRQFDEFHPVDGAVGVVAVAVVAAVAVQQVEPFVEAQGVRADACALGQLSDAHFFIFQRGLDLGVYSRV